MQCGMQRISGDDRDRQGCRDSSDQHRSERMRISHESLYKTGDTGFGGRGRY